ncbi:uncharacterized protein LOC135097422 isoform X7 [Scylla paramamosain]|uniref:uncharacterized protein LOC135097422 isoform X7 n=2 Tax=Scylla paramamosain TaxID=85552 RepID=UPI0030837D25
MQQLCLSLLVSDSIEPPPKEAPPKATEEEGSVVILDAKLFYKQQEKEVAEKIKESLAVTEYAKPSSALVLSGVSSSVVQYTVFEMQLSFTVLDTEGAPTSDLGHKSDPSQVTASLLGGPPGAIVMGTTTVPNRNGTAIFTNLSVSKPGEGYNLTFTITYPSYDPALTTTLEGTFSLTQMSAAMVLQQPSIVQAGQPTTITVHFVDKDSGLVLNGLAFKTFVGKLLAKTAEGHFEVIQRYAKLYVPDEAVSMLTFENVIFEAPDVRQQLIAKVAVVSASWTGGVSLTSGHQGVPHGQVLAHRSVLMEAVGGCGGCVGGWSAESVAAVSRHAGCWLTECTVVPLISLSAMTPRRP